MDADDTDEHYYALWVQILNVIFLKRLKFSRKDAKTPRKTKISVLENTQPLNLCDLAALREVNTSFQCTQTRNLKPET